MLVTMVAGSESHHHRCTLCLTQVVGYVPGHPPPDVEMGDEDAVNGSAPKRRKRDVYVGLAAANHRRDDMEVCWQGVLGGCWSCVMK